MLDQETFVMYLKMYGLNQDPNTFKELYECVSELYDDSRLLDCLRAAGVDNWQGWDDAIDLYNED